MTRRSALATNPLGTHIIMRNLAVRRIEQEQFLFERDMNRLRLRCRDNPCALFGWSIALAGAVALARQSRQSSSYFVDIVLYEDWEKLAYWVAYERG